MADEKPVIIVSEDDVRGDSWWLVEQEFGEFDEHQNSICLLFPGDKSWVRGMTTSWDLAAMRDQNARFVPDAEVPDEVWVALAKWRLTDAGD